MSSNNTIEANKKPEPSNSSKDSLFNEFISEVGIHFFCDLYLNQIQTNAINVTLNRKIKN